YDKDEQAALWGEDLYVYLDNVYRKATQYCVMFISDAYARKLWTNHERMSLQARDFVNAHPGSVLPARFDDTEIPGLRPQIGYVDLRDMAPRELARVIAEKVRGKRQEALGNAMRRSLELANDYLRPQPLASADSVAQEIRGAFASTGYIPSSEYIEPYLQSPDPSDRIVGYLAYQIGPYMGIGGLWSDTLKRELEFAMESKETRPLWQLLVCLGLFGAVTNPEEMQFMSLPLCEAREALQRRGDVDVGGQCASKLAALIEVFPWMWGRGNYTSLEETHSWDFVWQSGAKTYGLVAALDYVRSNPSEARYHIRNGHFGPWYELFVSSDMEVPDLMTAIAGKISELENR